MLGVGLGRLFRMMLGMEVMGARQMRVMRRCLAFVVVVMARSFAMMLRGFLVMFGGFLVMFGRTLGMRHDDLRHAPAGAPVSCQSCATVRR